VCLYVCLCIYERGAGELTRTLLFSETFVITIKVAILYSVDLIYYVCLIVLLKLLK
jgi:hypothetical protein